MIGTLAPAVSADGESAGPPERTIWVDDEFASYGFNSDPERTMIFNGSPENDINSYKDMVSYDPDSNTLTINNLGKDSDHCPLLRIFNMGQITLSVTGNSTLPHLGLYNTNLCIEGTGSLTLRADNSGTEESGNMAFREPSQNTNPIKQSGQEIRKVGSPACLSG